MDVITMQAVNKVLRKMNTEYGGMYEVIVATEGQDTFVTTESFSINNDHTLHIYVDGVVAVETRDYTKIDSKTVKFSSPLHAGEVVLFTTELAGSPKYSNPPYDDTVIKSDIHNLNVAVLTVQEAIQAIKSAIDEDGDGSIIDTIADIKTQWQSADSNLQLLINTKVDEAVVNSIISEMQSARSGKLTLKERLDEIILSIPSAYNDTEIKNKLNEVTTNINTLNNKVTTLEGKAVLTDSVTNRLYSLSVANGVLSANLILDSIMQINYTVPTYEVGVAQQFTVSTVAKNDVGKLVRAWFTIPPEATAEYLEVKDGTFHPLTDVFGAPEGFPLADVSVPFKATFTKAGSYTIRVDFKLVSTGEILQSADIPFTVNGTV